VTILASLNELRVHLRALTMRGIQVSNWKNSTSTFSLATVLALSLTGTLLAPSIEAAESAAALFKKGQTEYAAKNTRTQR
jgi:hypothetical protein